MRNKPLLLVAAMVLTAAAASAQTRVFSPTANSKPADQPGSYQTRGVPANVQIDQTLRGDSRVDNQAYVNQAGIDNWGRVDQNGDKNVANMEQINNSGTPTGNDAYQRQTNSSIATGGVVGRNSANLLQIGKDNYVDQTQSGNLNLAITRQEGSGRTTVTNNYSVQDQTGGNNYAETAQESNGNFAHQKQTSSLTASTVGGGFASSAMNEGNYARTLQGGGSGGTNGSDNQWSQTIQNGQNNRALVSQDH